MKRRYTLAFLLLCILPVLCPAQRAEIPAGVNPSSDSLHRTVAPNPPSDPDSLRLSRIDSELSALVGRDSTFRREVDVTSGRLSLSELLFKPISSSAMLAMTIGFFWMSRRFRSVLR